MTAQAQARIDGGALRANLNRVRQLAPNSRVMAVIKANAYGHGIVPVARALAAADALAVARMSEAIAVRDAGCVNPVVLLAGIMSAAELDLAARYNLDIVVHRPDQVDMLAAYRGGAAFRVWLKIDTGMNRLGFLPEQAADAWRRLTSLACVDQPRLMTHLSTADEPTDGSTRAQIRLFDELTAGWAGQRTVANSAGILGFADSHADWVRPGIMLYGVSPLADKSSQDLGLTPVMTLWSKVIAIKTIAAGQTVGYGGTWRAARATRLGIVAAGYGDGYPRGVKDGTAVLINGQERTLIGRVSMDMMAVDLGSNDDVAIGDEAILWGPGLPVADLAASVGVIPYELLCGISQRVRLDMRSQVAAATG